MTNQRDENEGQHIQAHLTTAKRLAADAMGKLREADPDGYAAANAAVRDGASIRVTAAFSVAGLCEVEVALLLTEGEPVRIAHAEFDGPEATH